MRVGRHVRVGILHLVDLMMSLCKLWMHKKREYLSHDFSHILWIESEMTSCHEL